MNPQLPQTDIVREKSWCKSYTQICDMLTNRLCELAGFLDLLLKHKVIFNTLAHEEQRNIRKAIEDSLNLSRNLTTLTEEHFLTTSNDALDDDHNISEFLRTFQNESQKKDRLIEVDKKGTHKIEEEKPVYYYNQSDGCNLSEDESKRRIALQMIQNEFTSVNVLRGAVFQKFSNNLKTLRDTIIIHDSTSREDIYLQKRKLEQTLSETRNALQTSRQNETQFQIRISERETMLQKLKRSLDEATLQISKAVLERTKFMKERDSFEKFGQEYKEKYDHLLSESSGLHTKLALLEHENAQLVLKKTNKLNLLQKRVSVDDDSLQKGGKDCHDQNCEMIEKENRELKHKLERTRKAFEKTWAQLRFSNQRKEQIEKDMRQEIYKTHTVLKSARSNIENMTAPSEINLN
ncbi:centrosomin-like [Sitodiplosis mosellana]|uniref:centrosomin-like n=1 Tax=Sitodiplosis mosellana TaxID=263140 RepID=UPI002443EAD2|nr:centrosomin-like [Sitodiplosis mosellana]